MGMSGSSIALSFAHVISPNPLNTPSSITDPSGTAEADKTVHFYRRIYSTTVYVRNPSRL